MLFPCFPGPRQSLISDLHGTLALLTPYPADREHALPSLFLKAALSETP